MKNLRQMIREEIKSIIMESEDKGKVYTNDEGIMFWAEKVPSFSGGIDSWAVIQQVKGYPATEAFDDWFTNIEDADAMAQLLVNGENPYD